MYNYLCKQWVAYFCEQSLYTIYSTDMSPTNEESFDKELRFAIRISVVDSFQLLQKLMEDNSEHHNLKTRRVKKFKSILSANFMTYVRVAVARSK